VAKVLLAHALGTHDVELAYVLLDQLGNVARTGKVLTAKEFNGIISIVRGICPRDPTEALLAAQMAAIHNATMVAARRMNNADNLPQQDSASNMLNKLARTFTAQIEALKKYRSDGEQTVKVQRVNVNDGGQAIIGNVTTHMDPVLRLRQAPRCSATSKRTGCPCRAPAERGKRVCRFHGARAGAPKGPANGKYCHGSFTMEALAERRALAKLLREAHATLKGS
jgi:hypothetical protein